MMSLYLCAGVYHKKAESCTLPFYLYNDLNKIRLEGTGVLIDYESKKFFISARHVFETNINSILIPSIDHIVNLNAELHFPSFLNENNQNEEFDIVIIDPSLDNISGITKFSWYPLSIESALYSPKIGDECFICGFPSSKIDRDYNKKIVTNTGLNINSYIIGVVEQQKSPAVFFDIYFNRDHKYHKNNRFAPNLFGMSGCGVWISNINADNDWPILIGIALEYSGSKYNSIKCISIKNIVIV